MEAQTCLRARLVPVTPSQLLMLTGLFLLIEEETLPLGKWSEVCGLSSHSVKI